jgi:methyl-accepting chemotaxis protein
MMTTTATSAEQSGAHKRSVRNYLLDSRFQLKYAGFLVLVAIAISAMMGAVLYETTGAVVTESSALVDESRKVSEVSRMNVKDFAPDSPELLAEFNREADAHDKLISEQQASLIRRQQRMILSLVGGLALMVVLIGLLGILFTHKVAGPVYKMSRLLRLVGDGQLQVEASLRRGDELKEFFDNFTTMVSRLRDREKNKVEQVELALAALDRGAKDEAVAALSGVRDTMKRRLEG